MRADGIELHVAGAEPILATQVVNSAGLRAPSLARRIKGYPAELAPPELYAKGNYYTLAGGSPFSRLVYPVPEPGGLGVHVTLDLGGRARFGPDVEWIDRIDYSVDPRRAERFYAAIRRYWPDSQMGRWGRTTRASAPRSRREAHPRRTSSCKARGNTVYRAWCTSSASNRPGSPPRCRSRTR